LARDPLGKHSMEVLRLAPFLSAPEPQAIGRVWDLRWFDYPSGTASEAIKSFEGAASNAQSGLPLVGCWSVEVGLNEDRVYALSGFRDWDHRDEVTARLSGESGWPPQGRIEPLSGGSRLLIPTAFSPFR
jgi:hypothetical protein